MRASASGQRVCRGSRPRPVVSYFLLRAADRLVNSNVLVPSDASTPNGNPNNNPLCGRSIRVNHEGKSVTVQVVDRCAACGTHDLDLSPVAFKVFNPLDVGRFQASWDWA